MNRTDRLMAIVLLLRTRRKLTAPQLADIFEVSTRTIYRDVDSLCQAGVPIAVELKSATETSAEKTSRLARKASLRAG